MAGEAQKQGQTGSVVYQPVANTQQGVSQLVMTVKNTHATDPVENVPIFPGAYAEDTAAALPQNCTMTIRGFNSRTEFLRYYNFIQTTIQGVQIDSTDVANWEEGCLTMTEKYPDGQLSPSVEWYFSDYRVATGGTDGFSKTLKMPPAKFQLSTWEGMRLVLNKILATTTLVFKFNVVGVTKVKNVSNIPAKVIG